MDKTMWEQVLRKTFVNQLFKRPGEYSSNTDFVDHEKIPFYALRQ